MKWLVSCLLVVSLTSSLWAGDWPQFRGPGQTATSEEKGLPETWAFDKNVAWKVELPGPGGSSPVVAGDQVFVTCYSGYGIEEENPGKLENLKRHLLCYQRETGKLLWERSVPGEASETEYEDFLTRHGYATHTPTVDDKQVYVYFGRSGVRAFSRRGEPRWQINVGDKGHYWGSAASPVRHEALLLINASIEGKSLLALDAQTGETRWKADKQSSSWTTPVFVTLPDGRQEMVTGIHNRLIGFDLKTGEMRWYVRTLQSFAASSPLLHEGLLYAFAAQPDSLLCVRPGGQGDVTETHVVWRAEGVGSSVTSPVLADGRLYGLGNGILACVRAADGHVLGKRRLGDGATYYASPVVADGRVYIASREQGTFVVAANDQLPLLATNLLTPDDSICNATPAISHQRIFFRSNRYLYCFGLPAAP